jgi:hypothetical protein
MKARFASASVAIVLAFVACSSSEQHPPALGDCVGDDASCTSGVMVGGPGGAQPDAAPGGACTVDATESQCDQCIFASCCSQANGCQALASCQNLVVCAANCLTSACIAGCNQQFQTGVAAYDALLSCASSRCSICSEAGVGDPCGAAPCVAGLTCNGQWCTKPCLRAADCTGIGASGWNGQGEQNQCMSTARGLECAPGCTVDAQCAGLRGTYCRSTTSADGLAVQVCASITDGGP